MKTISKYVTKISRISNCTIKVREKINVSLFSGGVRFFILTLLMLSTSLYAGYRKYNPNFSMGDSILVKKTNITLKTSENRDFHFHREIRKHPHTLIVFYRGSW